VRAELRDALSALADGEVADPRLVAEALLEPDAAALMVTLAEARANLRDATSEPGDGFAERVERLLAAQQRSALLLFRRLTPALYAGLGLTAGALLGAMLVPAERLPSPVPVRAGGGHRGAPGPAPVRPGVRRAARRPAGHRAKDRAAAAPQRLPLRGRAQLARGELGST
jgi:hypothetical protein